MEKSEEGDKKKPEIIRAKIAIFFDGFDGLCDELKVSLQYAIKRVIDYPDTEDDMKNCVYALADEFNIKPDFLFAFIAEVLIACSDEVVARSGTID